MVYFSITPTVFPEILFAHQFAQENYHHHFPYMNHNIEIAYIKIGSLLLTLGNQEFLAEEGSILLLPHNCSFTVQALSKNMHIHYTLNLHVGDNITIYEDSALIPSDDGGLILPIIVPPCAQSESLFQRLNFLIEEHHKQSRKNKYICACKTFELLCDIANLTTDLELVHQLHSGQLPQIYCVRIKEYIQKNLSQPITLSDLSVFLERNPDYLNRIFKKENGITIQQYINREKIKKCAELMTTKGFTLTQCCDCIGIKEPNYLSRLFKKHMGISASQFKLNSVYSTFPLVDKDRL